MAGPCVRRLQRELRHIQADGVSPTVFVSPHSNDITTIDALVVGPPDTPYDGAMLHFRLKVPPDYPMKPPQVRLVSTDGGSLRIHPQLYSDGKVCLSILGTWHGPRWSAGLTLRTLLLSIQSLLNEEPLRCEPGYEEASLEAVEKANVFVAHEVARILVLGPLTGVPSWGTSEDSAPFTAAMRSHLATRRAPLLEKLRDLGRRYDGQLLRDPFSMSTGSGGRRYDFAGLARRMSEMLPMPGEFLSGGLPASSSSAAPRHADSHRGSEESSGSEADDLEQCCRICHQTAEESGQPLIAPCRCSGSIRVAHAHCLLRWLQLSSAASGAGNWRCDICRTKFSVRLGGGRPPGLAYLSHDLDVFTDRDFEAPGLVGVLLISLLQVVLTTFGRVAAQALYRLAALTCSPLPGRAGSHCLCVLGAPAVALDVFVNLGYVALVFGKAAVALAGSQWRPACWGDFGEEHVGSVLNAVVDSLGFAMGLRLRGLMLLCCYFTLTHFCGVVCGQSAAVFVAKCAFGDTRAASMLAADPGLGDVSVVAGAGLPAGAAVLVRVVHGPVSMISFGLNAWSLVQLTKRAFFDKKPIPVDVLPMPAVGLGDADRRRRQARPGQPGRGGRRRS